MALYPLILNGAIVELSPVAFEVHAALSWGSDVSGLSPMPQPGWTATESSGLWSYAAPASTLTPAQQAQANYMAAIAGGLAITSTSTPAIDGIYAIDPASTIKISAEAQGISTFGEFSNGTTANLIWPLQNGQTVIFPTTALFLAFARAAFQAVGAADTALMQGAAMPAMTAAIA